MADARGRARARACRFQKKVFRIDEHLGVAVAGLVADGRVLSRYMRNECINHRFVYETGVPVGRLVQQVADKSQVCTQRSWTRPYGVGLLVVGVDQTGPHLFQTCPSGNYYEYKAIAIGARSQASKTYLEKRFTEFEDCSLEELCKHALLALKEACGDGDLNAKNCTLAFVGEGADFTVLDDEAVQPYLAALEAEDAGAGEDAMQAEGGEGEQEGGSAAPMES